LTNSVRTISAHLLTYGEQPSGVVILERRYGPRRLRDDDDDDDEVIENAADYTTFYWFAIVIIALSDTVFELFYVA